jgi:cytoskeletal protein CcmA (bactofilin family)
MDMPKTGEFAHIGKSVVIKGELSGSEDLYVDGTVEGTIQLQGNNLVIGPNGHVHADVNAKGVVVQGKLEGNIKASERAELLKSAVIVGDIVTQRIAIEDGAYFKGKVDIQKEAAKPNSPPNRTEHQGEVKSTSTPVASGAAAAASAAVPSGTGSLGPVGPSTPVTKQ